MTDKAMIKDGFGLSSTKRTLPMALLRAREVVMEGFRPILGAHGLSEQQWRVLRVLNEVEEIDATKLADRANILLPSLTRIIRLLEKRVLIETRRDPLDGRRTLASLSGSGRELILEIAPESIEIYKAIEAQYGAARLSRLIDEIGALIETLEKKT